MTPYALNQVAEAAVRAHEDGNTQDAIFRMLHALIRHEADMTADLYTAKNAYELTLPTGQREDK